MKTSIKHLFPWLLSVAAAAGTSCNAPRGAGEMQPEPVLVQGALNGATATWPAQGPSPITSGQTENLNPNNEVSGAIRVVLPHPTDPNTLYLGAVNGGIWRTSNATAASTRPGPRSPTTSAR